MGLVVGFFEEVDIVRGDEAEVERASDFDEVGVHAPLGVEAEIVDFDEVILRAEDFAIFRGGRLGFFKMPVCELRGDLAFEATAQRDESLRMGCEAFVIDARLVVKPLEEACGGEFDEVAVALVVGGEEREVEGGVLGRGGVAIGHRSRRDIDLAADDGLHAGLGGGLVKRNGRVHVAVVGDGNGGHPQGGGFFHQITGADRSIEQGKLRVAMQVDERHGGETKPARGFLSNGTLIPRTCRLSRRQ